VFGDVWRVSALGQARNRCTDEGYFNPRPPPKAGIPLRKIEKDGFSGTSMVTAARRADDLVAAPTQRGAESGAQQTICPNDERPHGRANPQSFENGMSSIRGGTTPMAIKPSAKTPICTPYPRFICRGQGVVR
jgi:hypothetical protein